MKINAEDKLYVDIASLYGAGRVPFAPGTFACILALPFYIFIHSTLIFAAVTLLSVTLGFAVCTRAEKALGKKYSSHGTCTCTNVQTSSWQALASVILTQYVEVE